MHRTGINELYLTGGRGAQHAEGWCHAWCLQATRAEWQQHVDAGTQPTHHEGSSADGWGPTHHVVYPVMARG